MIIHHQKVIISPQKCALIPQNRSFNHISLTFSLTFVEKCRKSHLRAFVGQIRQGARIRGWGVNPILAMPGFWVHMDSQPTPNTFTAIEVQLDKYVLTFSPADQMSPEICPENKFSPPGNHRLLSAVQNRPMCDFLDHFI